MKKLLFIFLVIGFVSCNKESIESEKTLVEQLSVDDSQKIVDLLDQFTSNLSYSYSHMSEIEIEENFKLIETLSNNPNLTIENLEYLSTLSGFESYDAYVIWSKNITNIFEKNNIDISEFKGHESDIITKLNISPAISTREGGDSDCEDDCDHDYWLAGIGVAAAGSACLPCGITLAAVNAVIWKKCLDRCKDD